MKKTVEIVNSLLQFVGVILVAFLFVIPGFSKKEEVIDNSEKEETVEEVNPFDEYREEFEANKAINEDYIGNIECNYFNYPVVQAIGSVEDYTFYANTGHVVTDYDACEGGPCTLNDVYLRMEWTDFSYELGGSIFMDYRNNIYDQNIILYGHHYPVSMDPNREFYFTPLEKLLEKENYKDSKYIKLILNNEVREYEIAYVYVFDVIDDYDDLQFYRTNYDYDYYGEPDDGYFQKYINKVEERKMYDTGVKLSTNDRTLTLQTCMENSNRKVEIVVAKDITK